MAKIFIFDPTAADKISQFRGGGRFIQILKENFPQAKLTDAKKLLTYHRGYDRILDGIFINPIFSPFQKPPISARIAKKQILVIFDLIPLKYPKHFPSGIKGKLSLFLNQLALGVYDKIITISNQSKKDIVQYLKVAEDKIAVVYPTLSKIFLNSSSVITTPMLSRKKQSQTNDSEIATPPAKRGPRNDNNNNETIEQLNNFCLYVGDVNWNKNLVNLARAIKIINVTCVFVGKAFEQATGGREKTFGNWELGIGNSLNHPWQKEFRDFLKEVGDDKRFVFLGYLEDKELLKLYQRARLNVLVSRDEGFGLSFIEAASQGCPSVLSDIEVFKETAADAAFFADQEDPYAIANKIGEIYFNDQVRSNLGKKAKKRASFFSVNKFRTDFLKAVV